MPTAAVHEPLRHRLSGAPGVGIHAENGKRLGLSLDFRLWVRRPIDEHLDTSAVALGPEVHNVHALGRRLLELPALLL
eukprot:9412088-Pyramimonas_sp.AAC.2